MQFSGYSVKFRQILVKTPEGCGPPAIESTTVPLNPRAKGTWTREAESSGTTGALLALQISS